MAPRVVVSAVGSAPRQDDRTRVLVGQRLVEAPIRPQELEDTLHGDPHDAEPRVVEDVTCGDEGLELEAGGEGLGRVRPSGHGMTLDVLHIPLLLRTLHSVSDGMGVRLHHHGQGLFSSIQGIRVRIIHARPAGEQSQEPLDNLPTLVLHMVLMLVQGMQPKF